MLRLRFPCILCFGVALPFQQVLKALLEFGARGPCAFNVSSKERAAHDKEASIRYIPVENGERQTQTQMQWPEPSLLLDTYLPCISRDGRKGGGRRGEKRKRKKK